MLVNSDILVQGIVIVIICLQLFFFIWNLRRMIVFRNIFRDSDSWIIYKDTETQFVHGIDGTGNKVFKSIKLSINQYLENNTGSIIDFNLLKDAVDRHCDSVEEDISTQTPVPLYCGLAGTMAGVIIGLWSLLSTGSIDALIGGASTESITVEEAQELMESAANGIQELLSGVAWAMIASICGIALTTINSLSFKGSKLKHEERKNAFLAWMQAKLLPELPNDTSDALTKLVKNLNQFNDTFAQNTKELGKALSGVNESYAYQAQIIQNVHDMDVMKMAKANVNVLKELKECTDKLEQFNTYLNSIQGYTESIQKFNEQFNAEAERLHIMEEIRDFFERNKAEIAKSVTNEDNYLQEALKSLRTTSSENIEKLKVSLTQQTDGFMTMNKKMCDEYTDRLKQLPKLESKLEDVAKIPDHLKNLSQRIEKSNQGLINEISGAIRQMGKRHIDSEGKPVIANSSIPGWLKLIITVGIILITISTIVIASILYEKNVAKPQQSLVEVPVAQPDVYDDTLAVETQKGVIINSEPDTIPVEE